MGSTSRALLPLRWQRVLRLTQISKAEIEAIFKVRSEARSLSLSLVNSLMHFGSWIVLGELCK